MHLCGLGVLSFLATHWKLVHHSSVRPPPQEIPLRAGHLPLVRARVMPLEHSYAPGYRPPQKAPFIYQITCFFGQEVGRGQLPLRV